MRVESFAREIELRFWKAVDRDGLTGLPSDMWAALDILVSRAAASKAVADTQREMAFAAGVEAAAQVADRFVQDTRRIVKHEEPRVANWVAWGMVTDAGEDIADAIRATIPATAAAELAS